MKRHLFAITLAAGMLLSGALLAFYLHQDVKGQVLSQFNESQLLIAQQAAGHIESYFDARSQDIRYLSSLTSVQHLDAKTMPADIQAAFTRLKTAHVKDIVVLDATGNVVYSTAGDAIGPHNAGSDIDAWAKKPVNKGTVRLVLEKSDKQVTSATGEGLKPPSPRFFLVTPLYQEPRAGGVPGTGGTFAGMLLLTVDLEMLAEGALGLTPTKSLHPSRIWAMDEDGTLLLQSEHPEMVLRSIRGRQEACNQCHVSFDYAEKMLRAKQGTLEYQLIGRPSKVAAFAPMTVEGVSWIVVVNAPRDDITGFVLTNSIETMGLFGVVGIVVGFAFLSVYRNSRQEIVIAEKAKHLQEKERLVEKLRESDESQKALNALLRLGLEDMTLGQLLPQALTLVLHNRWPVTLGVGAVFLVDEHTGELVLEAHNGVDQRILERCARVPQGHCLCGRVASSGQALYCGGIDERHEITYAGISPHGHYCIPIAAGETVLGVLNVYLAAGHLQDAAEEGFLGSFARTLAGIIVRKRVEEAEARLVAILEATPDLVSITDPEGRLVYVNRAGRTMLGIDALADLARYNLREFHDAANVHVVLSEGIPTAMREGAWSGETELLALDGHSIAVSQVILAHKGPNGTVAFLSTIARDITEPKRAQQTLRDSEKLLKESQSIAGLGSYVLDIPTGRWSSSPVLDDIFGIDDRYERTVEGWVSLVHPEWQERMTRYFADEVLGQHRRFDMEYRIIRKSDGKARWVHGLGELEFDARDNPLRMIGTIIDITERLQLEAQFRQAQKMESVGLLASGVAHDFNNLLTVINGMSELVLAQVSQDDPVQADVQEIRRAGERAATLTRQLLAFSRQQILEPRVLNLNTVVAGMESLLRRLLGEDIDLVIVLTPGSGSVKADPGQIEQVIANLAVNARDAMPQGGRLTIETENVTIDEAYARQHGVAVPPGPYVMLAVSDSGVGMDEATRARIFEPFFTTKGPGKGTGLGLSTVYGIVTQSHGFIWVYSEVDRGTSFKICLPQVTEAADTDQPRPTVVSSAGTETILLVEDNAGLRKLATRVLAPAGYTVLGAATGEEALRLLERHDAPVHLLLTDVVMPGMSGRDLAERLAQTHPGMKVLYMSGYTGDAIVRHGVLEARVPFLNKPFTAAALLGKVREVLDS